MNHDEQLKFNFVLHDKNAIVFGDQIEIDKTNN